ncbi:MAG: CRTAC1 family protein [Planctomycetes bacterium]|nr:CRTAC1 family protein [Planctomycetota bacterium]MCB9892597.1 CRTAC1 family protein [Planctomycetota bacterium]MCB9917868.1 CRTAC1 family protein [Planctomycetota bacterium]
MHGSVDRPRGATTSRAAALILVSLAFGSCGGGGGSSAPVRVANSFVEITRDAGLDFPPPEGTPTGNGLGAAAADYDDDGDIDVFVLRGPRKPALLFRNRGDGRFDEVGASAGIAIQGNACGPCFADVDGDGYLDLLVLGVVDARPRLFHNQGDGTFSEITQRCGIVVTGDTCSAAFGDYDRDGDLDLFITRWERQNLTRPTSEHLWRNNGDLTFTDVSDVSGISKTIRQSPQGDLTFTPNFADIDNDGWCDLLIAADFKTSRIYRNRGDGTFEDTTTSVISDDNGMGAAVADYDNDGDLDWFVSSIWHADPQNGWTGNRLYRNRGDGTFEDATTEAGVRQGDWGWGSSFADFDQDGYLDLVHVNGWFWDGFEVDRSRLFLSNRDGTFREAGEKHGLIDRGQGRGLMVFDADGDGDLDIFVENLDNPWKLFRNDLDKGNHLIVRLRDSAPNTHAIGARVYVTTGSTVQMREIACSCNYVSQNPAVAHFGLGANQLIDKVEVVWPDGKKTVRVAVDAGQSLTIHRN